MTRSDFPRMSGVKTCSPLGSPLVPHYFREARVECEQRHDREFACLLYVYPLLLTSWTFAGSQFNGMTSSTPASIR
jgi:hypothetical protein